MSKPETTDLQAKIDRLRVELANILPLAENYLEGQMIIARKDKDIISARNALEETK